MLVLALLLAVVVTVYVARRDTGRPTRPAGFGPAAPLAARAAAPAGAPGPDG